MRRRRSGSARDGKVSVAHYVTFIPYYIRRFRLVAIYFYSLFCKVMVWSGFIFFIKVSPLRHQTEPTHPRPPTLTAALSVLHTGQLQGGTAGGRTFTNVFK